MHIPKFAGHAVIYTLANFSVAGIPFLLLPVLTRVLSPNDYGVVALFSASIPFFNVLVGLNTHGAVMVRYFDKDKIDLPKYITSCFFIMIVTVISIIIIACLFSDKIHELTALSTGNLIASVFTAVCIYPIQVLLVLWQSSKQPLKYAGLRLSHSLLEGFLSIIFVIIIPWAWKGRVMGIALAAAATSLVAISWLIRNRWLTNSVRRDYVFDAIRFGAPLLPHALGGIIISSVDRIMITKYLDVAQTGKYFVGIQIGLVLGIAADAFNRAFAPWLMGELKNKNSIRDRQIVIFTYIYFITIFTCAIIIGIVTPWILGKLVGEQFQEAANVARYSLIGNSFTGMYLMVTNYIFFARKTELLSGLTIICGLITILCADKLIKLNGLIGAAQAYVLGQCILFIGTWVIAQRCHKMPWFQNRVSI